MADYMASMTKITLGIPGMANTLGLASMALVVNILPAVGNIIVAKSVIIIITAIVEHSVTVVMHFDVGLSLRFILKFLVFPFLFIPVQVFSIIKP